MHFNLHKTFSTPHGGGGPGAGPVAVGERLAPFLPGPLVVARADGGFRLERHGERPASIGRMRAYQGNVGVLVRAFAYIRAHGGSGLRQVSEDAVLAANYLAPARRRGLRAALRRPLQARVRGLGATLAQATGVRTLDVAKRLIDHGFHPPTIYFPLIVDECLLIEPTETESLETLDAFADALLAVAAGGPREHPEAVQARTDHAPVRRLDEATAARRPELRWRPMTGAETPCPQ